MAKYGEDYSRKEIEPYILGNSEDTPFWRLYKQTFIKTGHGTKNCSPYHAKYIWENFKKFEEKLGNIEPVNREKPYLINHSNKKYEKNSEREKDSVKKIVIDGIHIEKLGTPFDFQIPLKNRRKESDKTYSDYGEIDLLTDFGDGTIYMVEVKRIDTQQDTALSAILEIATYYHQLGDEGRDTILNEAKKVKGFAYNNSKESNGKKPYTVKNAKKIKMAVLFFEGTKPAEDVKKIKEIKKIAKELDVKIVVADPKELGLTSK